MIGTLAILSVEEHDDELEELDDLDDLEDFDDDLEETPTSEEVVGRGPVSFLGCFWAIGLLGCFWATGKGNGRFRSFFFFLSSDSLPDWLEEPLLCLIVIRKVVNKQSRRGDISNFKFF